MRGGTFRFGGIFGGINKKQNHNIPVNTLPVGYGSIPSLAPLISFRWCEHHLKHTRNPPSAGFLLSGFLCRNFTYPNGDLEIVNLSAAASKLIPQGLRHSLFEITLRPVREILQHRHLSKNTINGLSFNRPLNTGA